MAIFGNTVGNVPTYKAPTYNPSISVPVYNPPSYGSAPGYNAPIYRPLPTYTAQEWNESEIDALTQKRASSGLRAMRQQINRVSGMSADNPNMKRMTLRDALAGYGSGISNVMGAAGAEAQNEYGNKYARTSANDVAEYQSEAAKASAYNQSAAENARIGYQGAMSEWEARNDAAQRAAEVGYGGQLKGFEMNADVAKTNFLAGANASMFNAQNQFTTSRDATLNSYATARDTAAAKLTYDMEQKSLDSAWERYKAQQSEMGNPITHNYSSYYG
jgi:hypothetical protein